MTSVASHDAEIGLECYFAFAEAIQWNMTAGLTAMPKRASSGAFCNGIADGASVCVQDGWQCFEGN